MDVAPPQLVTYAIPPVPQNCVIDLGRSSCTADEDASGGFVVVVVSNSPTAGAARPVESSPSLRPTP